MPDIWRLKLARSTGGASWGDWNLYETREAMETDLFEAAVSAMAHTSARGRDSERLRRWFARWWNTVLGNEDEKVWTDCIIAVEHLVDGEWVEVEWAITPPVLTLSEPDTTTTDLTEGEGSG